ncbi:MAG: hypothetical protein IPF92_02515 [Myxococcales bacterium]|nr:hypothetical protein [Myxococcales bacterium]MBL0197334.1 hypothetical protein [Myxococcales bacterium]HQY64048.1 hypothetical protein [Polyangiaceae bacterium]
MSDAPRPRRRPTGLACVFALGLALGLGAPRLAWADSDDDPPEPEAPAAPAATPSTPTTPTEPLAPALPVVGLSPPSQDPYLAREAQVAPTFVWLLTQFVPSPELVVGSEGARFGVRWNVSPLLYSFGIHRRLSPWRVLVVEPVVRHSGSIEIFASPEWVVYRGGTTLLDLGVRSTVPLLHRGEYLSASVGVAYTSFEGVGAARYEAGLYTVFGVFGVVVSASPNLALAPVSTAVTLRLRYF